MLKDFRTFQLSVEFYQTASKLKLPHHLRDQLARAAASISLNVAEGYGRRTWPDKKRFYQIALGSMRECQGLLMLISCQDPKLIDLADHLAACLYKLCTFKR